MTLAEAQRRIAAPDTAPAHEEITQSFLHSELRRHHDSYRPRYVPAVPGFPYNALETQNWYNQDEYAQYGFI